MRYYTPEQLNLLVLRLSSGVKQYELAERLGVAPPQLSAFEKRGLKLPRGLTADDYVKALDDLKTDDDMETFA